MSTDNLIMKNKRKQYVYILENPAMPGIIKIGMTTRTPKVRAKELSSHTGVPLPFRVVFSKRVSDSFKIEELVHSKLNRYRVSPRREFFRISRDKAISCINTTSSLHNIRSLRFIIFLFVFFAISAFFVRQMFFYDVDIISSLIESLRDLYSLFFIPW